MRSSAIEAGEVGRSRRSRQRLQRVLEVDVRPGLCVLLALFTSLAVGDAGLGLLILLPAVLLGGTAAGNGTRAVDRRYVVVAGGLAVVFGILFGQFMGVSFVLPFDAAPLNRVAVTSALAPLLVALWLLGLGQVLAAAFVSRSDSGDPLGRHLPPSFFAATALSITLVLGFVWFWAMFVAMIGVLFTIELYPPADDSDAPLASMVVLAAGVLCSVAVIALVEQAGVLAILVAGAALLGGCVWLALRPGLALSVRS